MGCHLPSDTASGFSAQVKRIEQLYGVGFSVFGLDDYMLRCTCMHMHMHELQEMMYGRCHTLPVLIVSMPGR